MFGKDQNETPAFLLLGQVIISGIFGLLYALLTLQLVARGKVASVTEDSYSFSGDDI